MIKIKMLFEKSLSAIHNDNMGKLESLVVKLDDINFVDNEGRTLLFHAVIQNNIRALKILINQNANVELHDIKGWTPLHYAVNKHLIDIARLLIAFGANVNAKDICGNTVISRAVFASRGRGEIIYLLLKEEADPSVKNNSGISALKLAETIGNYNIRQFFT